MIFSVFVYLILLASLMFCGRYQNYRIKLFAEFNLQMQQNSD